VGQDGPSVGLYAKGAKGGATPVAKVLLDPRTGRVAVAVPSGVGGGNWGVLPLDELLDKITPGWRG
jgi:hypothetical protein